MRLLVVLLLVLPAALAAQTSAEQRVVPLEAAVRAGIDRDRLDSLYLDAASRDCTGCRFGETERAAYDDEWNRFLNQLMSNLLEKDVSFSELVLRCYFGADGRLDYMLFHVGGGEDNQRRFVAAAEKLRASFAMKLAAAGPYKQAATISLGAPSFMNE